MLPFTNVLDCFNPFESGFVKKGNSYEGSYGTDTEVTFQKTYAESGTALLQDYKAGKVSYEALNTFKKGLEEYFLFRSYSSYCTDVYPTYAEQDIDSYPLADYSDETISFKNVKVYGYPALKKRGTPQVSIEGLSSGLEYKV